MQTTFGGVPNTGARLCVESHGVQPHVNKPFGLFPVNGQPTTIPPCNIGQNGNGDKGFFFGSHGNNQETAKNEGNKSATNNNEQSNNDNIYQQKSNENNQLFAKIIENEMFNVPSYLKLDCMQEILAVVNKYTPKNNKIELFGNK